MSFMPSVPAQNDAVNYFKILTRKFLKASFILGGHSKGGNLAVYTGVFSGKQAQKKIVNIYNHDGPGFKEGVLDHVSLDKIKHCISKTIPQSSMVGMLMQQHEPYKVITSSGFAIMQHDPFTWQVDGLDFNYSNDITELSKYTGTVVKDWLDNTDEKTRKVFVDALFSAILNTNAVTFQDLLTDFKNNAASMRNTIKTTDPDIKKTVAQSLHKLLVAITNEVKRNTTKKLSDIHLPKPKFMHKKNALNTVDGD